MVVDDRFIEQWVERLRREFPGAVAILLKGSYARRDETLWSDLDFDLLVSEKPVAYGYLAWIVPAAAGRLVHVSVAVEAIDDWLRASDESTDWSFGFPSREATHLIWLRQPELRDILDRLYREHPSGEPEIEDFIESFAKARSAIHRGDDIALRLAVQALATYCPTLLAPLNPPVVVGGRVDALQAALDLAIAPPWYRSDMLLCLGLSGLPSTPNELLAAAGRLVFGTIALLEENLHTLTSLLPPDFPHLLRTGVLRRYLEQQATPSITYGRNTDM